MFATFVRTFGGGSARQAKLGVGVYLVPTAALQMRKDLYVEKFHASPTALKPNELSRLVNVSLITL
jgi:hypothetical protein